MVLVRHRLSVAVGALEHAVVVRIGMTRGADSVGPAVRGRKPGVVERGICPLHRVMARCARSREMSRGVIGIAGAQVIGFMAAITIRGQRQIVIVHVAGIAGQLGMRPGQRECRVVVIEGRVVPIIQVVTGVAGGGETYLGMRRIVGAVIISLVA